MNITAEQRAAMTPQDILNFVKGHLTQQKVRSFGGHSNSCMYRGPNGTKCAVGALITDEEYNPFYFEGLSVDSIDEGMHAKEFPMLLSFLQNNSELLFSLQRFHDNPYYADYEFFRTQESLDEWAEIAKEYNLEA